MLGFKKKRALVGVDIGSSAVKAVELKKAGSGYELVNLAVDTLTPDTLVDGAIMDAPSVSSTIERIFNENKITVRDVATSVSGSSVIVKRIEVQAATNAELASAIPYEAQQQLSLDLADVNLSYQVLGSAHAPNALDVMLVAAKREKVSSYTSVLSQAGKNPVLVDVDAFALQNAFEAGYEPPPDPTFALLNIGASIMNINIVRAGLPLFTRDVSLGGNQYTEALQKELDLSFDEAEKIKTGQTLGNVEPDKRAAQIRSVSESLLAEIQRTFDFFRQTNPASRIDRVYLAGGTARVEGLMELLERELKLPVEILDPFRRVTFPSTQFDTAYVSEIAPRMAVAVGLALRSFDST